MVSYKERKELVPDLKKVYQALTANVNKFAYSIDEAEYAFEELIKEGSKHPIIVRSWENNGDELATYFKYPYEIRKMIYTTNTIEAYHRQLRKVTKTKTADPNDEALMKIIYLATLI